MCMYIYIYTIDATLGAKAPTFARILDAFSPAGRPQDLRSQKPPHLSTKSRAPAAPNLAARTLEGRAKAPIRSTPGG